MLFFALHKFAYAINIPDMANDKTTLDIPENPAERRAWVIYQLHIRGKSLRRLAAREGVTKQAMSAALVVPNSHLDPVIAAEIGLTAQELFPERFIGNERRGQTRPAQRTPSAGQSQRQKGAVA